jgi:hypothetical protein
MPDRKIYLNGTSVPLYWTGEEEDGKKEYKNPCGCCCFTIGLQGKRGYGSGDLREALRGFLDGSTYFTGASASTSNSSSTVGTSCDGTVTSTSINSSGSGSGTITPITSDYSTYFTEPYGSQGSFTPKQFTITSTRCCQNFLPYCEDGCETVSGDTSILTIMWGYSYDNPNRTITNTKDSYSFSFSGGQSTDCEGEEGGQATVNYNQNSNTSLTLTGQIQPNITEQWARSNYANNNPSEYSISGIYISAVSVNTKKITTVQNGITYYNGSASCNIDGAKVYRIAYTPSPTGYLKVWLKRTRTVTAKVKSFTVPLENNPIITLAENVDRVAVTLSSTKQDENSPCESETLYSPDYQNDSLILTGGLFNSAYEYYARYQTVEIEKYSFLQDYEPDISDPNNPQPNGFPNPNWIP